MNHDLIKERLSSFYDGELPPADRNEIQSHLESCSECRDTITAWKRLSAVLFRKSEPVVSDVFVNQVMGRIRETHARPVVQWLPVRWFAPAVGIAAALLLAVTPSSTQMYSPDLLFTGNSEASSHWMFSNESPKNDDVLGFVMEQS